MNTVCICICICKSMCTYVCICMSMYANRGGPCLLPEMFGPMGHEHIHCHAYINIYSTYSYPIGSMYGIYANIWGIIILMVNVTIYGIHGSYGYWYGYTLVYACHAVLASTDNS